jgi:hypothetical protein
MDPEMDDKTPERLKAAPPSLIAATRRARVESAEKSEAVVQTRQTEMARLELLREAIQPIVDQAPPGVDLFDAGIAHGDPPRLFIDMIGFVEMAHDRRAYRFLQDTRHGRVLIAESERIDRMTDAIANYVARRIVERERALASDWRSNAGADVERKTVAAKAGVLARPVHAATAAAPAARNRREQWRQRASDAFNFLLLTLGSLTLVVLLGLGAYALWLTWGRAAWSGWFG